jgi:hypothetical protein
MRAGILFRTAALQLSSGLRSSPASSGVIVRRLEPVPETRIARVSPWSAISSIPEP